jgi:hypothetical protein
MKRLRLPTAALLILAVVAGCQKTAMPSLFHPRSANVQQKRALRYDPYPDPNLGPNMVGVRPREYENPPAEVSQARWHLDLKSKQERWGTTGNDPP